MVQAISLTGDVFRMAKSHLCSKCWKTGFHLALLPGMWKIQHISGTDGTEIVGIARNGKTDWKQSPTQLPAHM